MERIRGAVESRNTHHEGREEHEEKTSFCQKGQKKRNISSCPSCASWLKSPVTKFQQSFRKEGVCVCRLA
jgi:hypothetical protein